MRKRIREGGGCPLRKGPGRGTLGRPGWPGRLGAGGHPVGAIRPLHTAAGPIPSDPGTQRIERGRKAQCIHQRHGNPHPDLEPPVGF